MSALLSVTPNFGLVLPHMTDEGARALAAGFAAGAAGFAAGAKDLSNTGVAALNTAVAKGLVVIGLIGVTGWVVARVIHELRDETVAHNVTHTGAPPPPPAA